MKLCRLRLLEFLSVVMQMSVAGEKNGLSNDAAAKVLIEKFDFSPVVIDGHGHGRRDEEHQVNAARDQHRPA